MRRLAAAALAALFIAASALASDAKETGSASAAGRWSIGARTDDQVQLRLEYSETGDGSYSNTSRSGPVALAEVGLSADRLRGPIGPVTFQIQREPGVFSCTGSAGEGSGAGQFTYAPSARFDDALSSRGLGRPSYKESLELAISGTTLAFVDQIRGSAQHPTVADVVRVVQHGVNPRYLADLASLGYRTNSLDQLVRLRDHGVTPDFIRAIQTAGYRNLSPDDLIALRDHGVSVAFVDRLKAHGYTNVSVRDLIRLRDSGL